MKAKRLFAVLLCMIMLITTWVPVNALADSETEGDIPSLEIAENENESNFPKNADEKGNKTETAESFHDENKSVENQMESNVVVNDTLGEAEPDQSAQDEVLESDADDPLTEISEPEYPAFTSSKTLGDITVSVSTDEGVFPADAVLSVKRVRACPDEAIGELRSSNTAVAVSYTFDIKVIDPVTGEEYQPAEGQTVGVSFRMAEVADRNLDTKVYHISADGNAAALDVTTKGETATAQTDGFSLYTVEFTYNSLQYVLPGDSEVLLSTILEEVGLIGEVTEVEVSNDSLFSASDETGEWVVKALSAFQTNEWMKVTIGGGVFEIKVTDTENIASGEGWNLDTDGCLHITGAVTNPDTRWGELTPWGSYRSSIKSVIAEEGSSIDNGRWLFAECKNLVSADLHNLDTSSVTDMNSMFHACWGLTTLNITGFDTSNVTDMATMFGGCKVLTNVDVSGFDTSNVTTMDAMFFGCEKVQALDVSGFDTSKVEDMYGMFSNCRTLTELDVSGFDTSQVTELREMFCGCSGLTSLDVSKFDTSNCQVVTWMFAGCDSLESLDMSNWDVSSLLTDDYSEGAYEFATLGMFDDCVSLEEIGMPQELLDRTIDQLFELNPEWFHRDDDGTNGDSEGEGPFFLEKYSVTISDDGNGTVICGIYGSSKNKEITLTPDPNQGYHFKKWEANVEITNNKFIMPDYNVVIKAIFEINEYKVTFDARNHGTAPSEQTVKHGETATYPGNLTENGYTFDGWYTDTALTTAYDFSAAVTADLTLYAKWVSNSVTPTDPTNPKTGDNSHMLLWVMLLAVSGAALTGTAIYSRKRKHN